MLCSATIDKAPTKQALGLSMNLPNLDSQVLRLQEDAAPLLSNYRKQTMCPFLGQWQRRKSKIVMSY